MKKVIVLGSLNMDLTIQCVDLPKNGETINGSDFFVNPGGKGGNQAVAAAKLGAETHMIANIGNDVFGEQLLEALQGLSLIHIYIFFYPFLSSFIKGCMDFHMSQPALPPMSACVCFQNAP